MSPHWERSEVQATAPATDEDVEAAITELIGAHRIDAAVRAREADGVVFPPGFVAAKAGALRNLIARRVAEARCSGLLELRAWLVEQNRMRNRGAHGWSFEAHTSPADVVIHTDRLLAAPAKDAP